MEGTVRNCYAMREFPNLFHSTKIRKVIQILTLMNLLLSCRQPCKERVTFFGGVVINRRFVPLRFMCLGTDCRFPSHSCGCAGSVKNSWTLIGVVVVVSGVGGLLAA
jgi:hypothetical protein